MQPANVRGEVSGGTHEGFVLSLPAKPAAKTKALERAARPVDGLTKAPMKSKVERAEVRAVLARAAREPGFIADLTYDPCAALEGYKLSQAAKCALASGDVRWLEACLGKLDARLRTWPDCRLQQEIW